MSVAEIDEHRRETNDERKPQGIGERAGPSRVQNRPRHPKIKCERDALPKRERQGVGHCSKQCRKAKEVRRVVPAVELRVGAKNRLLTRILPPRIEGSGG